MENPQELLTRMDAVQTEIHQAEETVDKLKTEAASLWKEFKDWEATFATSIGIAAEPKRTKRTLKPRSLESNLRVALTHSLNRSKAGGLSKKDAIAAAKEKLEALAVKKGVVVPAEMLTELKAAADELFAAK